MKPSKRPKQIDLLPYLGKWILLSTAVAALGGSSTDLFLISLEWATETRNAHRWLIWLLPLAGFGVGWLYLKFGQHVEAAPAQHPLYIELIDSEELLRHFLRHHADELHHVRVVFFRCELAA